MATQPRYIRAGLLGLIGRRASLAAARRTHTITQATQVGRRTDRPSRGDAGEEGGVGHGGAGAGASRHREAAGGRERARHRPSDSSQLRLCACEATCARASLADEVGGDRATHKRAMPRRRPSPPPPPAASARARAGGPGQLRAARWRRPPRRASPADCGGPRPSSTCRRCPWHLREGAGCPSGAPMPSWGTISPRRCRGCRRRQRAALRRPEPPFERYEPWAKGCLWAQAEPAGGPPDGWDFRPKCTTCVPYLRFPR